MINRLTGTALDRAYPLADPLRHAGAPVRDLVSNIARATARHSVTAGCTALAVVGLFLFKPDLTEHVKALSPFASQQAEAPSANERESDKVLSLSSAQPVLLAASVASATEYAAPAARTPAAAHPLASAIAPPSHMKDDVSPQQQRVTNWIAKRYRVAKDATNMLVSAAYSTSKEIKIDPLLILAVMAIESRFNPFAESPVGAQGLMQVMSKVHKDKFADHGGLKAALNPVANIKVGSLILKEYVRRGGSVEAGLKMYVGAAAFATDSGYGSKVLAEYQRLQDVALGKNVPAITTVSRPAPKRLEEPKTEALLEKPPEFGTPLEQPA